MVRWGPPEGQWSVIYLPLGCQVTDGSPQMFKERKGVTWATKRGQLLNAHCCWHPPPSSCQTSPKLPMVYTCLYVNYSGMTKFWGLQSCQPLAQVALMPLAVVHILQQCCSFFSSSVSQGFSPLHWLTSPILLTLFFCFCSTSLQFSLTPTRNSLGGPK